MPQKLPDPPLTYRSEILQPLFHRIQARESCTVTGCASMGKTRLIDFLMRAEVQQHYLGSDAAHTLILRADCNRLNDYSEWGVYELLLTALVEGCSILPSTQTLRSLLIELRMPVLNKTGNRVLALRQLDLALHILCQEHHIQVRFLLDEFDDIYQAMTELGLANLRSLRDANKHHLSYVLFTRQPLARLRDLAESESFYELFSRSLLGLGPYTPDDVEGMLAQLQARRQQELSAALHSQIISLSGGHPGTVMALFDLALEHPERVLAADPAGLAQHPLIFEECRKLWHSLGSDEKQGLLDLKQGLKPPPDILNVLILKGLVVEKNGSLTFFSPLIKAYAGSLQPASEADEADQLIVDIPTHTVTIGGRVLKDLAPRVFKLVATLYEREEEVCNRELIIEALYDDDKHNDIYASALDSLVKRARKAIEPEPENPRYLVTCWGVGYRLYRKPTLDQSLNEKSL